MVSEVPANRRGPLPVPRRRWTGVAARSVAGPRIEDAVRVAGEVVAGERAAWYARPPESWEHVMPYGVRPTDQQRLVAALVCCLSGRGAA
jgi:hypothetical protein